MVVLPRFAKRETYMMRAIKRFHEHMVVRFGKDSVQTMRATAWQIEEYLDKHGKFADAEFMRALQGSLEKVVQMQCESDWTVKNAKNDLRGRTTGVNQFSAKTHPPKKLQRPFVPRKLSQAITDKFLEATRPDDKKQSS